MRRSLYQLLENQIIPLYYAKPDGKLPLAWLQLMRESIRSVTPVFQYSSDGEGIRRAALHSRRPKRTGILRATSQRAATELSQWKAQMRKDWPQVQIADVQVGNADRQNILVGEALQVSARVHLGAVDPEHVRVEAYHGEADNDVLRNASATVLTEKEKLDGDGHYLYEGSIPAAESGTYGFSVRVVPTHPHLQQEHELV